MSRNPIFFERYEALESVRGRRGELLHDVDTDRTHQDVKRAEENPHIQPGAAVEHAEPDALFHVISAVVALHHRDQVLMLEAFGLFQQIAVSDQSGGFLDCCEVIEKRGGIAIGIVHDQFLDRRYPGDVVRPEVDKGLASLDIMRVELQPLEVRQQRSVRHGASRVR